jgi:hypothetical protein
LLQAARKNLNTAEQELNRSAEVFEGHRVTAIELTKQAVKQVQEGLDATK